jgi:hypothetical protein
MHNWRGIVSIHHYNVAIDSVDSVNYSFPIFVLNDSLIKVGALNIPYYSYSDSIIVFQWDSSDPHLGTLNTFRITYNYIENTITYFKEFGDMAYYQDTSLLSE